MSYQVIVTHFSNPHRFYFTRINTLEYVNVKMKIDSIEKDLEDQTLHNPEPSAGLLVCVFMVSWKKLIRARIESIHYDGNKIEYVLWAVDYGFPLITKKENIFSIKRGCETLFDHIKCGGIANLLPTEPSGICQHTRTFNDSAVNCAQRLFNVSDTINFVQSFKSNDQHWGDLIITDIKGIEHSLYTELRSHYYGVYCRDFSKHLKKFNTTNIPPWQTCSGMVQCVLNVHTRQSYFLYEGNQDVDREPKISYNLRAESLEHLIKWKCYSFSEIDQREQEEEQEPEEEEVEEEE